MQKKKQLLFIAEGFFFPIWQDSKLGYAVAKAGPECQLLPPVSNGSFPLSVEESLV